MKEELTDKQVHFASLVLFFVVAASAMSLLFLIGSTMTIPKINYEEYCETMCHSKHLDYMQITRHSSVTCWCYSATDYEGYRAGELFTFPM